MRDYKLPVIGGKGYKGSKMDEKLCFQLWVYRGTAQKAANALKKEFNVFNKRTKKAYTSVAVMRAAKLYVLDNPDDARVVWEDKYGEMQDELWYDYLHRIHHILIAMRGIDAYEKWREDHPEVVEYEKSLEE